jgi:hypothetical protein
MFMWEVLRVEVREPALLSHPQQPAGNVTVIDYRQQVFFSKERTAKRLPVAALTSLCDVNTLNAAGGGSIIHTYAIYFSSMYDDL